MMHPLHQLNINPEEENRQLAARSASDLTLCSLKLAQRRPWLYVIYWNSLSNHHSFSHFEPELHPSLQFGRDAYAEVLFVIRVFLLKKPAKQKVLLEFLTISSSATVWLRLSSQTVLVWTPHTILEEFACVGQLLQTPGNHRCPSTSGS